MKLPSGKNRNVNKTQNEKENKLCVSLNQELF